MSNIPKVTVIIPVYGTEKYIERCARSLFEQTLDDIEYLFIDDCTPDDSIGVLLRTLEDYPYRKNQVRIISMEKNSGQAAVRKRGMSEAGGEYQIHCDSDDWVEKDMYEKMYLLAKSSGSDIVTCNFYMESDVKTIIVENSDIPDPRLHINNDTGKTWWVLWCRLIRSQLIHEHEIYPIPGLNMWEDVYVNCRVYYFANHLSHINEPLYHYDVGRNDMITKRQDDAIIQNQVDCIKNIELFFKNVGFDGSPFLLARKCAVKSNYLWCGNSDLKKFKHCFPEVKKYAFECNWKYKICWECAAAGFYAPMALYLRKALSNKKSQSVS